ncbi:SMAD/FHA domain-containing protein [Mycena galopus ATCC 62051]|nr:SMAD/FHA domain-containing protein [Mycena galopus ATCC 62051]
MAGRRSASPPHRNRDSVQRHEHRGSGRHHDDDRESRYNQDRGYSSRYAGESSRDDRRGGGRREYSERDREQERAKDRDRYDRRRDGESPRDRNARSRRSASPHRRSSRPHSPDRSRSRSLSPASKAKPDYKPSGLLAAETNTVKAVNGDSTVLKYNEPPEARKPILGWRLYVFKGSEQVELLHIHRQSAYLFGRDRLVADVALDHPRVPNSTPLFNKDEFGVSKGAIKPFVIDLESTNGTHVNDQAIPVSRYYELKANDVIKFGQSTREYVLLHEEAA